MNHDAREHVIQTEQRFGARVRAEREKVKMPQWHVAHVLSLTYGLKWDQSIVARTESADRPIRLVEAAALAELFDLPLAELIDDFREVGPGSGGGKARALLELDLMRQYVQRRQELLEGNDDER